MQNGVRAVMRQPFFSSPLEACPKILTVVHRESCIRSCVMKWDSGFVIVPMLFPSLPHPAEVSLSDLLT